MKDVSWAGHGRELMEGAVESLLCCGTMSSAAKLGERQSASIESCPHAE